MAVELKYNNQLLLVERLKTTYQGGSTHPPGVDSYYYTRAYPPGWVYKQRTIGNAFAELTKSSLESIEGVLLK